MQKHKNKKLEEFSHDNDDLNKRNNNFLFVL